jgi:hypothetical protein
MESGAAPIFAVCAEAAESSAMTPCTITDHYEGNAGQAAWKGCSIADGPDFQAFLRGPVRDRLRDAEEAESFAAEIAGLAATGIGVETVEAVLSAEPQERQPWEVGEALAEALLEEYRGVVWPWNKERDKLAPKASLPGADLVGLVSLGGDDAALAVGEVKTSSDTKSPPSVMSGRSGMAHQLQRFEGDPELQCTILKWLRARCKGTDLWPHYQSAVARFMNSGAHDFVLFGLLMRDTEPHSLDLEARGKTLGDQARAPTTYELSAWYLPCPIDQWPGLTEDTNDA